MEGHKKGIIYCFFVFYLYFLPVDHVTTITSVSWQICPWDMRIYLIPLGCINSIFYIIIIILGCKIPFIRHLNKCIVAINSNYIFC